MAAAMPAPTLFRATPKERPAVERLLQLYLHDFSEFAPLGTPFGEIGDDGLFPYWYGNFAAYWSAPDHEALLARVDGRLAGLALLNPFSASGLPVDRAIVEFFVLRKYRRAGIGTQIFRELCRTRPGQWEIAIAHYNAPAQAFWPKAVAEAVGSGVERLAGDGARWSGPILRFRIAEPPSAPGSLA